MESVILVEVMKVIAFLFLAHALEPGEQRAGKKGTWQEVSRRIGSCPRKCMVGMGLFLLEGEGSCMCGGESEVQTSLSFGD